MLHSVFQIHNVDHAVAVGHKPIRKKPAVAAPPKSLRTHEGHVFLSSKAKDFGDTALEVFGEHVIRVVPKSRGTPGFVWGRLTQALFSIAAQFPAEPDILDALSR